MATKDSIIAKNICDLCAENDVRIEFRDDYTICFTIFKYLFGKPRIYRKMYSIDSYLNPISSFADIIEDFSNEADRCFEENKLEGDKK